jgi:hypothetical protein
MNLRDAVISVVFVAVTAVVCYALLALQVAGVL